MYKQVLTYTIDDDFTRDSFAELIEGIGFEKAQDQSTWVLPFCSGYTLSGVVSEIVEWSKEADVLIRPDDFVQIFFAKAVSVKDKNFPGIGSKYICSDFDSKLRKLILEQQE